MIEGDYTEYIVPAIFDHSFIYNKFDHEKCIAPSLPPPTTNPPTTNPPTTNPPTTNPPTTDPLFNPA